MTQKHKLSLILSAALLLSACITVVEGPGSTPGPSVQPSTQPSAQPSAQPSTASPPKPSASPITAPTAAPTALPGSVPSVVPSAMVGYEDLFEKPENLTTGWLIEDGPNAASGPSDWHIAAGKLIQTSNIYRSDDEYAYFEGSRAITRLGPWNDYRLLVDITPTDDDGVGVIFRYQDGDNYYRLLSVKDAGNHGPFTRLELKRNGSFKTLAEVSRTLHEAAAAGAAEIRLTAHASQIQVEVNGELWLQASDSSFLSGKAGLSTYACSAEFSQFRVQLLR